MSEELAIIPTVAVVVFKNDNPELVCLVEHLPGAHHVTGTFGLPAGRVQVGEKNIDAGVRELQEETGLTASSTDMIFLSQYEARIQQKEGVKHFTMDAYLCTHYVGDLRGSGETSPQWTNIHDVGSLGNLLPNIEKAINRGYSVALKK
ncbi:MAG: NUDIX hydrolase [Verrucomicrobiota bacterium]|nr:MAG: NUDIX hydrolase [Candidatus Moranbacteria bacterium]